MSWRILIVIFQVTVFLVISPSGVATDPVSAITLVSSSRQNAASTRLAPYQREDYLLAFDAFVAARELEKALLVAQRAVENEPQDLEWRLKLARVAEWTGHAELAWSQYAYLYRSGQRSDEILKALVRLGYLGFDAQLQLEAWLELARQGNLTQAQWRDIATLFDRAARSSEGASYFERLYRQTGNVQFLEWAAQKAEYAGLDDLALKLYRERASRSPFSATAAIAAASFLIRKNHLQEAYDLLIRYRNQVPAQERKYWETLGGVAWELARNDTAEDAYRRYLETAPADAGVWYRLLDLVAQKDRREESALAFVAYHRTDKEDFLLRALSAFSAMSDDDAIESALSTLSGDALARLENMPRFLVLRANHYQRAGKPAQAWQDLERAIRIAPLEDETALAVLWFLIDQHDANRLESYLRLWQDRAAATADYWSAYAAGFHALDRYREAVEWYRRAVDKQPDNALLLLNYADALQRLGHTGMASRIRRHAWLSLEQHRPHNTDFPLPTNDQALAALRLMILDRPGDGAARVAMRLASLLRGLPAEQSNLPANVRQQAHDLVLSWAVSTEQYLNARRWMLENYLRRVVQGEPIWGVSQVALQLDDAQTLQQLLSRRPDAMPIYNRYDAAYRLGERQQALDIAFHGLENNPDDQDLHERLRLHVPHNAHYLQFGLRSEDLGYYRSHGLSLEAKVQATNSLALYFQWSGLQQSVNEPLAASLATRNDTLAGFAARWLSADSETRFSIARHHELANTINWRIGHQWSWGRRMTFDVEWESGSETTESLPLRIAGYRNGLRAALSYSFSKRETFGVALRRSEYYTQFGDRLGSGYLLDLDLSHRLRTEYPDWRLRIYGTLAWYQYDDIQNDFGGITASRYFLPQNSQTYGLCFGKGENLAGQAIREYYSRGWREYYELCATNNSNNGFGYRFPFGLVGSLTGEDHVYLGFEQAKSTSLGQSVERYLWLRYRRYF